MKRASLCPHLLRALQPLLQLHAQLVGRQPELSTHPLWPRHAWPQAHACRPTRECPSLRSEHQTLWPHCGHLWRKLSLGSWRKLGWVGGEFRVQRHWAGSGLLGWEVLAQRVKTASLGRGRQTQNRMVTTASFPSLASLYSRSTSCSLKPGTEGKLGITFKIKKKTLLSTGKQLLFLPNPAWWCKYLAQGPTEDAGN